MSDFIQKRATAKFYHVYVRLLLAALLSVAGYSTGVASIACAQEDLGKETVDIVKDRLRRARQLLQEEGDEIGQKTGKIIDATGKQIDQKHPGSIHPMMRNDGADDASKSKEEYGKKDTEALFNDKTVSQCLEDRQVFDGTYNGACAAVCRRSSDPNQGVIVAQGCPRCLLRDPVTGVRNPNCVDNPFYVSEMYFPVYEARVYPGRAMGSFDPTGDYLSGDERRPDLKLKKTQERYRSTALQVAQATIRHYTGKQPQGLQAMMQHQAFQQDLAFTDRHSENNLGDPQAWHTLVYQTNAHRKATRSRPVPEWEGYMRKEQCFFHTLDNAEKKTIARASYDEEEAYMKLAMRTYETNKVADIGKKAWKATDIERAADQDIYALVKQLDSQAQSGGRTLPQLLQKLPPSQRASVSDWAMRQGLQRAGIQPTGRTRDQKDYVWYGIERAPFNPNIDNGFTTPLYAAIGAAVAHYSVTSLPGFPGNSDDIRPLRFTLHKGRDTLPNYTGKFETIKDKIVFTDKIQVIYPPKLDRSGSEGGERQGSHCFRPESLARNEVVDSPDELERRTRTDHNGLRRDMAKYFPLDGVDRGLNYANEVRIAFWEKRVNCYCAQCGVPYGCVVLNDGDLEEDDFYGSNHMLATSPPVLQ